MILSSSALTFLLIVCHFSLMLPMRISLWVARQCVPTPKHSLQASELSPLTAQVEAHAAEFAVEGLDDTNCLSECQANSAACASTCAVNGDNSDACKECLGVGTHCRATHREILIGNIREKWQTINKNVKAELESIITLTH
jgi:hypothetical protein